MTDMSTYGDVKVTSIDTRYGDMRVTGINVKTGQAVHATISDYQRAGWTWNTIRETGK